MDWHKKYLKYKMKYLNYKEKYLNFVNKDYINELKTLYPNCIYDQNEDKLSNTETYGEMEYEGIETLYDLIKVNNNIEYFIDIGSGRGKLPCWFANLSNIQKSIGIEIIESRHNDALNLVSKLSINYPDITHKIFLFSGDIFNYKLNKLVNNSSNTLIWISNLCFGTELTNSIFKKIIDELQSGTIIACSKNPDLTDKILSVKIKLITQLNVKMSWNNSSNIFILQII